MEMILKAWLINEGVFLFIELLGTLFHSQVGCGADVKCRLLHIM
jgi:hypothetical protein